MNARLKYKLRGDWERACNGYLCELLRLWELDAHYGYWIADEVGGLYDYGDGTFTIGIYHMIYCVENSVSKDAYIEWQEYCCEAHSFGFDMPNLNSWMEGCPRVPSETFERLRALRRELDEAIEQAKVTQ